MINVSGILFSNNTFCFKNWSVKSRCPHLWQATLPMMDGSDTHNNYSVRFLFFLCFQTRVGGFTLFCVASRVRYCRDGEVFDPYDGALLNTIQEFPVPQVQVPGHYCWAPGTVFRMWCECMERRIRDDVERFMINVLWWLEWWVLWCMWCDDLIE